MARMAFLCGAFRSTCAAVLAVLFTAVHAVGPSDTPWYVAVSQFHFPHFFVTDLNNTNWQPILEKSTADYVLVEFYVPWCPHCQHFAPDYERLGLTITRYNNGTPPYLPPPKPEILTTAVDCMAESDMCNR